MKIKINKEQSAYINGLETREAKKDFILEHILLSLEANLDRENTDPISFKDGEFHTSDANLALYLLHFPHLFKPKDSGREKFDKFIEDNGLKKFTPPEQKENLLHFDLPKSNPKDSKININDLENGSFIQKTEGTTTFYDSNGPIKLSPESLSKEQLKDITKPKCNVCNTYEATIGDKCESCHGVITHNLDRFLTGGLSRDLGWNANGTNEIPKGEIDLDAFPATDKFFKDVEWASQFYDSKLLQALLEYKPPHPDKKYTKEDMENAFNRARYKGHFGDYTFDNFEDYLKHNI